VATVRDRMKRVLVGRPIASAKLEHQLLPKTLALPVFSSDPLSSNAYATEEMMLVLVLAGAGALTLKLPIALLIATVIAIVVTSYRQTVRAYPRGGGSYIVARENLGKVPGLVAASAILTDYVLTVAVSMTAGVVAIVSAAPGLREHRVILAVVLIAFVALANLRGVKEAGTLFAIPTYGFVLMVYATLAAGLINCLDGCPRAETADLPLHVEHSLTLFLILRAFASGSTALTGIEAIADGVQAFRRPQGRNAATTLAAMAAMTMTMFIGITFLAGAFGVRVTEDIATQKSVLAQIGDTAWGGGAMFYVLQAFTALILILAANTAYQDFPRLSAILARDRFLPGQFKNRGDRLVFSNGILVLSVLAALLVWVFDAQLTRLIQLYVVGVFTAFTLSQAGMVRRWIRLKEAGWRRSAVINGIGATATGVVLVIVTVTKFRTGAWIVITAMPIIIIGLVAVNRHYERVHRLLRAGGISARMEAENTFLFLVPDLGLATREAVSWLRASRPDKVVPLYIGRGDVDELQEEWLRIAPRLGRLERLPMRGGQLFRAVQRYVREEVPRAPGDFVTVVVAETVTRTSFLHFLQRRMYFTLKVRLLFEPGVVVVDIPLLPTEVQRAEDRAEEERPLEPERDVVLVPVSAVHDATVRALAYAKSLQPWEISAVFFAGEPEEVAPVLREWQDPARAIDVPLTAVEAPFRDIEPPLLAEVRRWTAVPNTLVTVVLPEFVFRKPWRLLLHNGTALFIKRMLLFEPDVVVVSVPVHLD
jgi:amino acid transporter